MQGPRSFNTLLALSTWSVRFDECNSYVIEVSLLTAQYCPLFTKTISFFFLYPLLKRKVSMLYPILPTEIESGRRHISATSFVYNAVTFIEPTDITERWSATFQEKRMLFWREKWPKVQYSCENRSGLPKSLHNFFCSFLNIVWEFQSLPSQQRVCATAKLQQRHIKPSSASENKPSEYRRRMAPDTFESRIVWRTGWNANYLSPTQGYSWYALEFKSASDKM